MVVMMGLDVEGTIMALGFGASASSARAVVTSVRSRDRKVSLQTAQSTCYAQGKESCRIRSVEATADGNDLCWG